MRKPKKILGVLGGSKGLSVGCELEPRKPTFLRLVFKGECRFLAVQNSGVLSHFLPLMPRFVRLKSNKFFLSFLGSKPCTLEGENKP